MLNQFSRTKFLYGKEAIKKLSGSRVAIFGIGGVDGYTYKLPYALHLSSRSTA